MTAPPDAGRRGRRADVQGLRALAVGLVVVFHAGLPVTGGFVGVDVFFVISGFVIIRALWFELGDTGRIDLPSFYAARARRLLPALALLLGVVAVASAVLQSPLTPQQQTARTGIAAAVYAANAWLFHSATDGYFATPAESNPLLHTWTLAVEEQLYLVFPALLVGAAWVARRKGVSARSAVVIGLSAVTVGSLVACVLVTHSTGEPFGNPEGNRAFAFYASPLRAWEFAAGGLLALAEPSMARWRRGVGELLGVTGLGLVLVAAAAYTESTAFPGIAAAVPVLGALMLIAAGTTAARGVPGLLRLGPATWVGDVSYGWYLWHWPAIVLTRTVWPGSSRAVLLAVAAAMLVPTVLSYRLLEMPIRLDRSRTGRRAVALALVCTLAPVGLHGGLLYSTHRPTATVRDLARQNRPHADVTRGCTHNLPDDAVTAERCTWRSPGARGSVVLIGDSNAGQFAEPVLAATRTLGLDLTLATYSGCPFGDVVTRYPRSRHVEPCRRFVADWVTHVARSRPSLVILASASSTYLARDDLTFTRGAMGTSTSVAEKAHLWQQGVEVTLRSLDDAGVPSVVVHPVPVFRRFTLHSCPAIKVYRGTCGERRSRADVDAHRALAVAAERRAVGAVRSARALDVTDAVCSARECRTARGSRWLYRDINHLSVDAALELTPRFVDVIRIAARPASAAAR